MTLVMSSDQLLNLFGANQVLYTVRSGHVRRVVPFSGLAVPAPIVEFSDVLTETELAAKFSPAIKIDDIRE